MILLKRTIYITYTSKLLTTTLNMGRGKASKAMRHQTRANLAGHPSRANSGISQCQKFGKKYPKRRTIKSITNEGCRSVKQCITESDGKSWQVVEAFCVSKDMWFPVKAFRIQKAGCPMDRGCISSRDDSRARNQELEADSDTFRGIVEVWCRQREIPMIDVMYCMITETELRGGHPRGEF